MDDKVWERIFCELDKDRTGYIPWPELLSLCRSVLRLRDAEGELHAVFQRVLDADDPGKVEIGKLLHFVWEEEEACEKAAAEETQGQRVAEEARLQAAEEEVRHRATAKEARREAEEEARQKAEVEPRRKAAARGEEEKMGLRERYEALGHEGSFFFGRAMGLEDEEEEEVGGESDADLV